MATIDIILLIILAFAAWKGFRKGFVLEIIAILAFILAIIGGFTLLHHGIRFLNEHFEISSEILPYAAFLIIFVLIVLLVNLIGRLVKKLLHLTPFGMIDNVLGMVLSVLKWGFGLSVLLWLTVSCGFSLPEKWTEDAVLYTFLIPVASQVVDFFSGILPFARDLFEIISTSLQYAPAT